MQRGFTLIELVIVMVLIGILAAYAVPRMNTDFTANNAATELMQAIRYAQQQSMTKTGAASPAGITLSSDGFTFNNVSSSAIEWRLLKPSPSYSVTIAPTGGISFDGHGVPNCTGNLTDCINDTSQAIDVSAKGNTVTIHLEPYTGFVHK